jgi:hypothetical protein
MLADGPDTLGRMTATTPVFHDSSWYCYANSTAMLLSSIGETVSPRLIEALTGVGLGASFNKPLPFFGELQPPDTGITQALELLGFAFDEEAADKPEPAPFERLEGAPVLIGPLDMSHLVYNPMRPRAPGVDHYVLVLERRDGHYRLHDPAGFAHARLAATDLAAAWRADTIAYRRGPYRSWRHPHRIASPSADAIFEAAMDRFRTLYRAAEKRGGCIGHDAIVALAKAAREDTFDPAQRGHLLYFALPLGAKRALDYAAFFDKRAPRLAELKRQQAELFGACHAAMGAGAREELGHQLDALAGLEPEIKRAILTA